MSRISWYPLAFGVMAMVGAALAFDPAFVGGRWVVAMVVAIVMSATVMAWTVATRTGTFLATLVSAAAALVTTTATVLSDTLGESVTRALSDFFEGVTTGWNDSLQEELPLVQPALPLVWATTAVWIGTAVTTRALAAGRASVAAFLAPPIVLTLAFGVTVTEGTPSRLPVVLVAVGLLGVLATTSAREIDQSWGQLRATALVIVIAVLVGLVAMRTADNDPEGAFDPRTLREDSASEEEVPDLLSELDEIASADPVTAMNLRVVEGERPSRMRLAVYDEYDGVAWRTTTSYREVLQFTPPPIQPVGDPSTVQVQVVASPGPWLPLLDRAVAIRPSIRGWDEDSGTALFDALTATVRGSIVTELELLNVTAASSDVDERYTDLPSATPPVLLDLAAELTAESPDARSAVAALRDAVLAFGRDDSVPSGHSLGRLAADTEAGTPMAPEQLVALHATLVRAVGIPSRIVVGYGIGEDDEVSTSALTAWTEVAFAGVGWVPFDPVPTEQVVLETGGGEPTATTTTLPGQSVTEAQVVPRELNAGERNPQDFRPEPGRGIGWTDLALVGIVLLLVAISAVLIARRSRRRGRRKASSAPWSIAGAWGELLDRLRETSAPSPPNRTVEEAADQVEEMAPGASTELREFTRLVNLTLYSDTPPDWDDAEHAWHLLRDIERHLRRTQGRSVRVRAWLDPRSLRYPTPRPAPNRARRPHPPRPRQTDHPRVQR